MLINIPIYKRGAMPIAIEETHIKYVTICPEGKGCIIYLFYGEQAFVELASYTKIKDALCTYEEIIKTINDQM